MKLIGGINSFASSNIAVTKWCLNRADQAKNTSALKQLAEIEKITEVSKSLGPSQIMSSEKKVQKVMEVLLDEYINPFGMDLDKVKLVNLSSGAPVDDADDDAPVDDSVAEILVNVYDNGNIQAKFFRKERLVNNKSLFHNPVKRCRFVDFKETSKSVSIRKDNKTLSLKVNCNIIGALSTNSAKSGKVIDL